MQIDYTSRDFSALKQDLINLIKDRTNNNWDPTDYSDLGNVMVESFSYMGDIMSHYIDRAANETSVDTAIKRDTLLNFANLYGYKPSGPTPATVDVTFTNNSIYTVDLPVGTQVMAPLTYSAFNQAYFETVDYATAVEPGQTIVLACEEGKTVNTDRPDLIDPTYNKPLPSTIGTSTGATNQQIVILDMGIVDNSVTIYVGQGVSFTPWSYVDSLTDAGPYSAVFTTVQNTDGTTSVIFGDNVNGMIPASGQLISAVYKTSVGLSGNVVSGAIKELTFIPGNISPDAISYFSVTNSASAIGGADADNSSQLRTKIKAAIATRRRAVTLNDYEYLASQVSRVGKIKASAAVYSSINIYVEPQNDSSSTPGLKATSATISNIVGSGTVVTVTTTADHNFSAGQLVSITGASPTSYNLNGVYIIGTPTTTSFTVSSTITDVYSSSGTATSLTPTTSWSTLATAVETYLSDKCPVGTTLTIRPPIYTPVYVSLTVNVGSAYKAADIKLAIYKAFLGTNGLFNYDNNFFGATVPFSSVVATAQNISGVTSVTVTKLNTDNSATAGDITLNDSQIPYLLAANLQINTVGGIA